LSTQVRELYSNAEHLASGLDSYAWRISLPESITYYEMDLPNLMQYKLDKLKHIPTLVNFKPIATNLKYEEWSEQLLANGFDCIFYLYYSHCNLATKPTLWITMGFLLYLTEDSVHTFLSKVSSLSAPGSLYTADIVCDLNDSVPEAREMKRILAENNTPAQFTTDTPSGKKHLELLNVTELFACHSFKAVTHIGYMDYADSLKVSFFDSDTPVGMQKSLSSLILAQKEL
jgi:methyltransferase (TIGR00027 family)